MLRLIVLVLLGGAFLGGYHLGRKEGSPDIFGWAEKTCGQVNRTAGKLSAVGKNFASSATLNPPKGMFVEVEGKTYQVGLASSGGK